MPRPGWDKCVGDRVRGRICCHPRRPRRMPDSPRNLPAFPSPSLLGVVLRLALLPAVTMVVLRLLWPGLDGWIHDGCVLLMGGFAAALAASRYARLLTTAQRADADQAALLAQERLRHSAEEHLARTRAIVATATEGIVTIDQDGIIDTFNSAAERLFGYRAEEVLGRNVSMLMPAPWQQQHDGYLQNYLRTGIARIIGIGREVLGLRKDGTTFPIDLSVGAGTMRGRPFFTALIRDVTERKDMQTKLAQTERLAAVGELSAGVAHEVNNPVNTIINCAQLIADGDDAPGNARVIIEEGERIASIVKDLLQFARDDRDRPQPTSIADVVTRTLRLIGENFKRHGIALRLAVPPELPAVNARPQQLQQVLLNLLINAKDALLQEGKDTRTVHLSAAAEADGVRMSVRDNGPGIPPQLGNHVFEPFVTTKRARGGTGLGLSISKGIVEGYGGTIEVVSSPGQGADFRVWLPLSTEPRDADLH
ncbi:MAG: PAS domain S-box protein [Planctomycetes bacterium]|nr:PAS domain S-box protein [Planctomycetota bacterium]